MSVEIADNFTDDAPDGDYFPSGIGGCIGVGLDEENGYDAQEQKAKGPNQVKGEAIETISTAAISTGSYLKSVKDASSIIDPSKKDIFDALFNEASHHLDDYNTAHAFGDMTQEEQ